MFAGRAAAVLALCAVLCTDAASESLLPDRYEVLVEGDERSSWERGPVDAPVVVEVVFAPGHVGAATTIEVIRKAFVRAEPRRDGAAFRQVLRLVPLRTAGEIDPVSEALVEAAHQGKLFTLLDRLCQERSPPTQRADVQRLAEEAGLDGARLARALDAHTHDDELWRLWRRSADEGRYPAEVLANGRRLSTWMNLDTLDTALAAAARRAEQLVLVEEGLTVPQAVRRLREREAALLSSIERNRLRRLPAALLNDAAQPDDPRRGPGFAPIRFHFIGTLGQPASLEWATALRRLEADHPGLIQIVFSNIVVLRGSSDERLHAIALQAVDEGKFWALYDAAFPSGPRPARRTAGELEAVAQRLGIDVERALQHHQAGTWAARIEQSRTAIGQLALGSSPVVLCNGMQLPSGLPYQRLRRFVELELERGALEQLGPPPPPQEIRRNLRLSVE